MSSLVDRRHLLVAAQLLDDLDGQRRRERATFEEGYQAGFEAGRRAGAEAAEEEMRAAWAKVAEQVRRTANTLTYDELARRRAATGPWEDEYRGGPVEWEGPRTARAEATG
ncbi:hypothetical protein [Streptosporangium sp. NPDC006007]|uniref:hypothetical protein n=1 Tax=Streptosporangium sp. NPDC006007 TaxID=3154575 RepID=UPI0033A93354